MGEISSPVFQGDLGAGLRYSLENRTGHITVNLTSPTLSPVPAEPVECVGPPGAATGQLALSQPH